ncbi:MAG: hypothetical protein ABI658_11685 [Acidimicrobiales bacterium]
MTPSLKWSWPPVAWGVVFGAFNALSPIAMAWLDPSTAYALVIPLIAGVYIGFAVADGRTTVIVVESIVASVFVMLAAAAITGTAWLLVAAYAGHGIKDLWQHRTHFVENTRWWPPFCLTVDWVVAAVLIIEIAAGFDFR